VNGIVAATTDPAVVKTIKNLAESSDVEDPATNGSINDLTSDLANGTTKYRINRDFYT
jgi:hypothetical protein